jgi:hypothetical protein
MDTFRYQHKKKSGLGWGELKPAFDFVDAEWLGIVMCPLVDFPYFQL